MTLPVPRDKPQLPSVEVAAVAQAIAVAEAMLNDLTDADPLAIKSRANAAIHHCDERNWPEAKREFAYAAICCEFRWTKENPRRLTGTNQHEEGLQGATPVPKHTATRIHDAYEVATADDVRAAKETEDAEGETINRGHVRQEVEAPADAVERKAKASAQRAKAKRQEAMNERQEIMRETLESGAARAHAAEAELAARNAEDDDARDDALAELATANKNLVQVMEMRAKQLAELREKLIDAEGLVAYWKKYSEKIEARTPTGRGHMTLNIHSRGQSKCRKYTRQYTNSAFGSNGLK